MGVYLQRSRHGTIFYFRRKLPTDLRPRLKVPQLFVSLGTADRSVAMLLARRAATRCDELFHQLRTMADTKANDELIRRELCEGKTVEVLIAPGSPAAFVRPSKGAEFTWRWFA